MSRTLTALVVALTLLASQSLATAGQPAERATPDVAGACVGVPGATPAASPEAATPVTADPWLQTVRVHHTQLAATERCFLTVIEEASFDETAAAWLEVILPLWRQAPDVAAAAPPPLGHDAIHEAWTAYVTALATSATAFEQYIRAEPGSTAQQDVLDGLAASIEDAHEHGIDLDRLLTEAGA